MEVNEKPLGQPSSKGFASFMLPEFLFSKRSLFAISKGNFLICG